MWDPLHPEKTIEQVRKFCAFQDRCTREVREKIKSLGVPAAKTDAILAGLEEEGFVDDTRFVRSFVLGKFRHNKWGKVKILYGLKSKGISEALIREGLDNIDEEEYTKTLVSLITAKLRTTEKEKNLNVRQKIVNFALGKGYELTLILEIIKTLKIEP